ncbi:MAG TPA: ribonuclease H-like domain-containing protein [Anaerolineae bacterium]
MPIDAEAIERLRKLRSLGVRRGAAGLARPVPEPITDAGLSFELPGEAIETPFGPAWVRTAAYPLAERPDLAAVLAVGPAALAGLGRDDSLLALDPGRAAYVDTETTGLSLGTGTYTFLIGIGRYEELADGRPAFVVHQYLMRNPGEERGQLHLVEEALAGCTGLVTFNGRAFDLPLLQNRFMLAYLPPPLPGAPHLDLLPPARRIWRARLHSCSLGDLERQVLGLQRSAADVPGWMIPGIYRDFYNSPSAANLELMGRVFYHNLEDITSMAILAGRMAGFFAAPDPAAWPPDVHPLERASLARCYQALAWNEAAEAAYLSALDGPLADGERVEVFRSLSLWFKRTGRRAEAAALWETWIGTIPGDDLLPFVELAKHHEWHTGDLAAARGWTAWALRLVDQSSVPDAWEREALRRRLDRLEQKLAGRSAGREAQPHPEDNIEESE